VDGPRGQVCLNAWDTSPGIPADLSPKLAQELERLKPFWVIIGRGDDRMKGSHRVDAILKAMPGLHLVACPGQGFENDSRIFKTGRQESSEQV